MDSAAVGGDVFEEMCKPDPGGKETGEERQQQLATDLVERVSKQGRSNLLKSRNTTFMVVIRWVLNRKDMFLAPNQLQASYTDVRHREELIDFINKPGGLKEPYILTLMF